METNMPEKPFFVTLKNRGLIYLDGPDRYAFLQGLITNDIEKLTPEKSLYACLLSPQGKFLHDFFVIESVEETTLIDCEGGARARDLFERLNTYKLRKSVTLSLDEHKDVYAVFGRNYGWPDPRHSKMGDRCFFIDQRDQKNMPEKPFEEWDRCRIELTIPDGSRDLIPEKSTMDEGNMDRFNAIDYQKGCYVGQELTARMHYRGLGKKRLQTVSLSDLPNGAELRSTCGDIGIALVKS
ncbi:MAG TPA: folate-binding protein [Alphaproteobacteria bacterium]|nr:folate-binding protein YgfZ [Alphaproteobacteria bacterium]USO05910.1 MAG: folate-binding protein YgfZ [Rhodospirillales bacterium]HOO81342.1 folate-binding protein [Alphaproteobacteria bacterium]